MRSGLSTSSLPAYSHKDFPHKIKVKVIWTLGRVPGSGLPFTLPSTNCFSGSVSPYVSKMALTKTGHIVTLRAMIQLDNSDQPVLGLSAYCLQRDRP